MTKPEYFSKYIYFFIFVSMWIKQRLVVQMENKLGASKSSGCQCEIRRSQTKQCGSVKLPHHKRFYLANEPHVTWPGKAGHKYKTRVLTCTRDAMTSHLRPEAAWVLETDRRCTAIAQEISEMTASRGHRAVCQNVQTKKDNVHFSVVVFMRESTWFHPVNIFHPPVDQNSEAFSLLTELAWLT